MRSRLRNALTIVAVTVIGAGAAWSALRKDGDGQRYKARVAIQHVELFGRDKTAPVLMDIRLKYVDCPGEARQVVRGDRTFSQCGAKLKKGDIVEAELISTYHPEQERYRSELLRLGDCPIQLDPKEEANYETIQTCTELKASGATVGVRCTRKRSPELLEKCPWLRR